MADDEFLAQFESCTLAWPLWTHEAHVRMAWLYLSRLPLVEALARIRTGIQRYNAANGRSTGYHETITCAFAALIASRLELPADAERSFEQVRARFGDLLEAHMDALLVHYTRDHLFSDAARAAFILPDQVPLPSGPCGTLGSRHTSNR